MRLDKTTQPRPRLIRVVSFTASGYDKPSDKDRGEWLSKRADRPKERMRDRERETISGAGGRRKEKENVKRERRSRPN